MNGSYYDKLTNEQASRWIALILAIDNIDEYCEHSNKPIDDDMLKPIAIKHFIQEKSKAIQHELDKTSIKSKNVLSNYINGVQSALTASLDRTSLSIFSTP